MNECSIKSLKAKLSSLANPGQAKILSGFFKTGKGQYGEGDIFLGIKVPILRGLIKEYKGLPRKNILQMLHSQYHEYRLLSLLILVYQFEHLSDDKKKEQIYSDFLDNTAFINNWDLVDFTAPNIVGAYLCNRDRKILYRLARSGHLWERRISILSTFTFIKQGETKDTFAIADILMNDQHDLIQKATGWMLREAGKRVSEREEKEFLEKRYRKMPRTMLRYAIEKFNQKDKSHFMAKV